MGRSRGPSKRRSSSLFSLSLLAALAVGNLHAAQLAVRVQTNTPTDINLPWPYDDSALQEPRGYNHHGVQARHILRQLIIENPGPKPLTGGEILVDGKDWRAALLPPPMESPRALFTAWTQARSHAASGLKAAQNPWQMLQFWGYTLCGEDTKCLGALFAERGIAGRSVPLNGHVAGEYNIDGRWSVMDGDQNIVYFNLDNTTLASYTDIRADPFLALRTKPFGRFAQPSLAASQFNAGLFEYVEPGTSKPFKYKPDKEAAAPAPLTLYPGERLVYYYDKSPATQVGDPQASEWKKAAPSALRLVELQVLPKARGWKKGPLEVKVNYPILAAQNFESGDRGEVAMTELGFSCMVPVSNELDRVSVWMQRAQVSLPVLHAGKNQVSVQADAAAGATVRVIYDASNLPPRPAAPRVEAEPEVFRDFAPKFALLAGPGSDRIWWQIAGEPQFRFVAPNLDQVERNAGSVELDPLANTFLNPATDYYLRVKTVGAGVWSEWSQPRKFRVHKPAAPSGFTVATGPGGRVFLKWETDAIDVTVFASNRLDFLPDIYAREQVTTMRGLEVQAKRPNQTHAFSLAHGRSIESPFPGRYIRVIARIGGMNSNPSALFTLPDELCKDLPPSTVFQVRWTRQENADPPDVYEGEERPLKP
jgi:hypothetical protein